MEKITKREMYLAIAEMMDTGECKYPADAVKSFCENEITLLDKKAAKAKENAAKKKAESDELTEAVYAAMSDSEFEPIAVIAGRIEGEDVTVSKITYRLTQLVKSDKAVKQELTVPGGEGQKTRKIMGYRKLS